MQLIETTNNTGLVEYVERETRRPYSSSGDELRDIINDLNIAQDELMYDLIILADNVRWDDPRHSKKPSATFNLSASTNEHRFAKDSETISIRNITHVGVKDSASDTAFRFLERVKSNDPEVPYMISPDTAVTGKPSKFLELGGRIFFDVIPETAITSGGKIIFGRDSYKFTVTGTRSDDTTEAGIPIPTLLGDMASLRWFGINESDDPHIKTLENRIKAKRKELRGIIEAQHPTDAVLGMAKTRVR